MKLSRRFWDKVLITDTCWLWMGAYNPKGYGQITIKYKRYSVHRLSYERFVGELVGGLVIDHTCRNTTCIRPSHLEQITNTENILRGNLERLVKTHCPQWHEYTEQNSYLVKRSNGIIAKHCRTCMNQKSLANYYRLKRKSYIQPSSIIY